MTGGAELPWHCFNCLRLPPFLYPVGQQCGASRRSKQFDAAGNRPQRAGGRLDPIRSAPQGLTGEAGGSSRALPAAISYGGVGSAPPACWGYSYGLGTLGQNEAFELLDEELAGPPIGGARYTVRCHSALAAGLSIVPKPVESCRFENHGFAVFLGAFSPGLSASSSFFFEWMPRAFNAEQA